MKTLVPPPITKGPWKKVTLNTSNVSLELGVGSDEAAHNAVMALAAPAMAEALLDLMEMAEGIDTLHMSRAAEWGVKHRLEKARKTLLAAGYTETADQE